MTPRAILVRETLISVVVNAGLSAGFFFAMFGLADPISGAAFGRDFLPQAFMVALMGSLVPGLLVGRRTGASVRGVVIRAIALAAASLAIAGGGALAASVAAGWVAPGAGLLIKILFGAVLSAIVTPIAVTAALVPQKVPQ